MKWPWGRVEEKSAVSMVALSQLPGAQWGRGDAAALTRDGYTGNAVAYRCVRMIAEACASIPLGTETEDVRRILSEPSPDQTGRDMLERLYRDLQISGNAWAEAVTLDGALSPRGVFNLPAGSVRVMQDAKGHVSGYAIRTGRGERIVGRESDGWCPVLHLKLYHPGEAVYGFSPMAAARKALDLHNGASGWAKALLDNATRPSGALIYGKDGSRLTDIQFDRLKDELTQEHAGSRNAGRPLLLEGGLEWKPMSLSPAEMDFQEARYAAAREIALAFGVPPMLLGIPGDNTYSNYKEANTAFWRQTVLPLVQKCAEALSIWLGGRFDEVAITPDLDQVPAFMADRDALWKRVGDADFLSAEEKRRILGLET
ncbi:MAG: phage portal protein [Pseudomonadota bacterium]